MTLIQRVELLAKEVEKLGEGGGGDLSAYLTKTEASNTYETQSAASAALALKADKSTTYTKSETDSAIETGASVASNLFTTTTTVPASGSEPVPCAVPWSHIVARNDFTMVINIGGSMDIRFSFSQTTHTDNVLYKCVFVDPDASQMRLIIVDVGPAEGEDPTSLITFIGYRTL